MELTLVLQMTKAGQPCTLPPAMAMITSVSGGEFCLPAFLCAGILKGGLYFDSAPVRDCSFLFLFCQSCQLWSQGLPCLPAGGGAGSPSSSTVLVQRQGCPSSQFFSLGSPGAVALYGFVLGPSTLLCKPLSLSQ